MNHKKLTDFRQLLLLKETRNRSEMDISSTGQQVIFMVIVCS
jgi:hypothetical protein